MSTKTMYIYNISYLPTRERMTVNKGAAGNAIVTFKSNIWSKFTWVNQKINNLVWLKLNQNWNMHGLHHFFHIPVLYYTSKPRSIPFTKLQICTRKALCVKHKNLWGSWPWWKSTGWILTPLINITIIDDKITIINHQIFQLNQGLTNENKDLMMAIPQKHWNWNSLKRKYNKESVSLLHLTSENIPQQEGKSLNG